MLICLALLVILTVGRLADGFPTSFLPRHEQAILHGQVGQRAGASLEVLPEAPGVSRGVFTPEEGGLLLSRVGDDLKPFLALWCFSGLRAAEIARLDWCQVKQVLESGTTLHLETMQRRAQGDVEVGDLLSTGKQGVICGLHSAGIYLPCLLLFLKLVPATVVMGLIARRAKTKCEGKPWNALIIQGVDCSPAGLRWPS